MAVGEIRVGVEGVEGVKGVKAAVGSGTGLPGLAREAVDAESDQ